MPAEIVLGQPDFQDNVDRVSQSGFTAPVDIFVSRGRLFVADQSGHRVMIWNQIPKSNNEPADVVLGQPDFDSSTANNGGRSARSLNNPTGVFSDGTRLFVVDRSNSRALIWNQIPEENFAPADVVVGQADFVLERQIKVGRRLRIRLIMLRKVPQTAGAYSLPINLMSVSSFTVRSRLRMTHRPMWF